MSRRTALGQVLGLGSAKEGADHWWAQRWTAVALALLGVWFGVSVAAMVGDGGVDFAHLTGWLNSPVNAVFSALFIATACYHSSLGVQVIIEDYVGADMLKVPGLILVKFVHAALGAIGIYAILRISFGGVVA
ncbi:MAG: succinate dehydrogenase, hydrophobic membrane anchor protein [Pseudomonadota bacterium]